MPSLRKIFIAVRILLLAGGSVTTPAAAPTTAPAPEAAAPALDPNGPMPGELFPEKPARR